MALPPKNFLDPDGLDRYGPGDKREREERRKRYNAEGQRDFLVLLLIAAVMLIFKLLYPEYD